MRGYELTRKVVVGSLTIRLWISADEGMCQYCEEAADDLAMCAAAMADEEELPTTLVERLSNALNVRAVEVVDDQGNGSLIRSEDR